jgi:UDP-N-acetylmuramate--alanine ligase
MKKIYFIWIGGIWISAIARYYNQNDYEVFGSDSTNSKIIWELKKEWINIIIWTREEKISKNLDLVIYTEAISKDNPELLKAKKLGIKTISYPQALAEIANSKKLIAIAWTHWKSTTTSLISIILKNSWLNFWAVVWSLLKEFWEKNFYYRNNKQQKDDFFVIEACEYKRSFLNYKPYIAVITNIELDHLDYYKDLDDYLDAFVSFVENIQTWWFLVIDWNDKNARELAKVRQDINIIRVFEKYFTFGEEIFYFKDFNLKVPWEHIKYDAKLAYVVWYILGLKDEEIIKSLEKYNGIWRRMEIVWETKNKNLVISDYWHHPTEIKLTLWAIKNKYLDKEIFLVFQPHQYNRTLELLEDFKDSFLNSNILLVPDIYESRDSIEDKKHMNTEKFLKVLKHKNKINWEWLKNTLEIMKKYDKENKDSLVFVLMWAWNVDNLRQIVDE